MKLSSQTGTHLRPDNPVTAFERMVGNIALLGVVAVTALYLSLWGLVT